MQKIQATGTVTSRWIRVRFGGCRNSVQEKSLLVKQSLKSISRAWIMTKYTSNNLSGNLQKSTKGKTPKQVFGKDPHPSLITYSLSVRLLKLNLAASKPHGIYFAFLRDKQQESKLGAPANWRLGSFLGKEFITVYLCFLLYVMLELPWSHWRHNQP